MKRYETIYCITQGYTVIGALGIGVDGLVNWAHPCLGYACGWQREQLSNFCHQRGWVLEAIGGYS